MVVGPAFPDAAFAAGNGSTDHRRETNGRPAGPDRTQEAPFDGGPNGTERVDGGPNGSTATNGGTAMNGATPVNGAVAHEAGRADHDSAASCTAPQLRRFIKSRPYVPMHELRRRFGINGHDDDVTPVDLGQTRIYVGLPYREGSLLGELLRGGDIGYELSLDPHTPVVIGLYPMRPVARN